MDRPLAVESHACRHLAITPSGVQVANGERYAVDAADPGGARRGDGLGLGVVVVEELLGAELAGADVARVVYQPEDEPAHARRRFGYLFGMQHGLRGLDQRLDANRAHLVAHLQLDL